MFDWLGDIFNSDTFDTLKGGFDTLQSGMKTVSPFVQGGLSLINGLDSVGRSRNFAAQNGQTAQQLVDLFSPNSPYAQQLRQQLERRDAAAGRRSQYGTRETELAAALSRNQAGVLNSPQYQQLLAGANRSPYGGLMGSLGQLFSFKDKNGNFKTPPGTSRAAEYLADTLFPGAMPDVAAASLGGADSAIGATPTIDPGTYSLLGGTEGQLPGYSEAGGPQGQGIFSGYGTGSAGELAAAQGLEGAGAALGGGLSSGALGGSVGGADALGFLGGSGFLPSYGAAATEAGLGAGSTAGASGLFGGAGAGAAGGEAGAGAAGLGGAGAASLVALPFALAIGGMLNGIFGPEDGPAYSARDRANDYANQAASYTFEGNPLYKSLGSFNDWLSPEMQSYWDQANNKYQGQRQSQDMDNIYYQYDTGPLAAYMKATYGNPTQDATKGLGGYTDDQYSAARDYFQGISGKLGDYNPYLGGYSPGWNQNGG